MNNVYIVSMGVGSKKFMTFEAVEIINSCDVVIGGKRYINCYDDKEKFEIKNNLSDVIEYIDKNHKLKKIAILASGDAFMYGIGSYIVKKLNHINFKNISGISSIQYLANVCGLSWQDIYITSVHARKKDICSIVSQNSKIGILTDSNTSEIINKLYNNNFGDLYIYIGQNLSYEDEKILVGNIKEFINEEFSDLCILIIINNSKKFYNYISTGIPDELFERDKVPMTKEEVRALSLSKLKLTDNSIVFDIGCGTGSVTVECGIILKNGFVYSVDRNREAVNLTNKNIKKFNIYNAKVFEDDAIHFLKSTNIIPTRVFIGGSGNKINEILNIIYNKCDNVRIVVNCITIESLYETIKFLNDIGYINIECVSVSVSKNKKAGSKNMMIAQNMVYIITGEKGNISER